MSTTRLVAFVGLVLAQTLQPTECSGTGFFDSYFRPPPTSALQGSRCPKFCLCGTGTSQQPLPVKGYFPAASCVNQKLTSFPVGLPAFIRILIVRGNALRVATLPDWLPSGLSEIDASYNMINEFRFFATESPMNTTSLRHINFNYNRIEKVTNYSFVPSATVKSGAYSFLSQVEVLLLAHNRIRSLEQGCFTPLVSLRWLSLTANMIKTLPIGVFDLLPALTDLVLDQNRIYNLTEAVVGNGEKYLPLSASMTSLRTLNLASNVIENISSHFFTDIGSTLEQLDLSFNKLRIVPTEALRAASFRRLQRLNLDGNLFTSLPTGSFEMLQISELSLSHMPLLSVVERNAIVNVKGLTEISLHDNQRLVYVHQEMVSRTVIGSTAEKSETDASTLKSLLLHRNRLPVLECPLNMPLLETLTLYGNPLQCNCNNDWIRRNETKVRVILTEAESNATEKQTPWLLVHCNNMTSTSIATQRSDGVSKSKLPAPESAAATAGPLLNGQMTSLSSTQVTCSPVVIVSRDELYSAVGEKVELYCQTVGRQLSTYLLHWMLPSGKVLNVTDNYSRIRVTWSGSLVIVSVKPSDDGKYTCVLSSPNTQLVGDHAMAISGTGRLHVFSTSGRLIVVTVGSDYVSVTWSGLEPTVTSGSVRYAIVYRPLQAVDEISIPELSNENVKYENHDLGKFLRRRRRQHKPTEKSAKPMTDTAESKKSVTSKWCKTVSDCLPSIDRATETVDASKVYRKVDIRSYMHGYWVGGLESGVKYEFCIGLIRPLSDVRVTAINSRRAVQVIHCVFVTTTGLNSMRRRDQSSGTEDFSNVEAFVYMAAGVLTVICLVPGSVGLVTAFARRVQRRRSYVEPSGSRDQEHIEGQTDDDVRCLDSISSRSMASLVTVDGGNGNRPAAVFDIGLRHSLSSSTIQLDSFFQMPSTPLVTSRTSLIS